MPYNPATMASVQAAAVNFRTVLLCLILSRLSLILTVLALLVQKNSVRSLRVMASTLMQILIIGAAAENKCRQPAFRLGNAGICHCGRACLFFGQPSGQAVQAAHRAFAPAIPQTGPHVSKRPPPPPFFAGSNKTAAPGPFGRKGGGFVFTSCGHSALPFWFIGCA